MIAISDSRGFTNSRMDTALMSLYVKFALDNDLGVIPDPIEPYFSRKAIAKLMGYSDKTFMNNKWSFPDIQHPAGNFYRLSEFVEKLTTATKPNRAGRTAQ